MPFVPLKAIEELEPKQIIKLCDKSSITDLRNENSDRLINEIEFVDDKYGILLKQYNKIELRNQALHNRVCYVISKMKEAIEERNKLPKNSAEEIEILKKRLENKIKK